MDAYSLVRIEDLIDQLGKAEYMPTLDLTMEYWQVPIEEALIGLCQCSMLCNLACKGHLNFPNARG